MANIKQLLISGIRSFGPDDNDKQNILFKRPLTLILGENGCGKTTIIECLKYALCGELPPNCNKGQSFVHDPKVNKSRDVLGQIRLQIVSPNGTRYLIVRSMQAQLKQKTMQFKTIDSTLQIIDDPTNPIEISGRCGQTDATIASILGVSKAILNNVIFCHQEDSSWPLEEGKKLKERFDAIFDATKYNKCFESIRKLRKQYAMDINRLELDVKYTLEKRQEYDAKKLKMVSDEEKIKESREKQRVLSDQLLPLQKRLGEIGDIENNIVKFKSQKESLKARLEILVKRQNELKQTIKSLYTGTDEDLKNEIDTFANNLFRKQGQYESAVKKLNTLKSEEARNSEEISSLEIKKSQLFTLEEQHQEKVASRNTQLLKAANFAEIEVSGDMQEEEEASKLLERIERKRRSLASELKDFREKCSTEEKALQMNVDSCRDASARHKQKIICRQQECNELTRKLDKLRREILVANQSKDKLETIQRDLATSESELKKISEECDVTALQDSITSEEAEITKFEKELEHLDQMISKMQAQQSKQTEISLQKEALGRKQKIVTRYKNKNRDSMADVLGKSPEKNYKLALLNCQRDLKNEVADLNKTLKLTQHKITTLESKRAHQKEELASKKNEVTVAQEQLYNCCGKLSLEDKLTKLDSDISILQDQKNEVSSFEFVTRKFVEKLNEDNPCCPLCHRGFETQQEVTELISELGDKVRSIPKNLDSVLTNLSRLAGTRDELVSLRPLDKRVKTLKDTEIPSIETALDQTEKELQEANDTVDELQMSLSEPERKLETVTAMLPDMSLLDQALQEVVSLSSEIVKLESQLEGGTFEMSLEDAGSQQTTLRQKVGSLRASVRTHQTELNKHNRSLQQARDTNNRLKEESLRIQAKIQELCSLQSQLEACEKEKEKSELDLRSLAELSNLLESELSSSDKKKKTTVEKNKLEEEKQQKFSSELDKHYNIILGHNKEIREHEKRNIRGQLEKLRAPLAELQAAREGLQADTQTQAALIDTIKDQLSNQQVNKRDLDDNLSLRTHQKDETWLKEEIKVIEDKIGDMNYSTLATEKGTLLGKQNDVILKKAETEGIVKKLQEIVKECTAELQQPKYKNIYKDYKKKFYELVLLKAADKDLKDYSTAMDMCLMEFHKEKMSKINNIIRDMWRKIYRGNDIDYIEIKTDENADSMKGNKRVYNYRVVQRRNDTEIDLRGRCSAGQKVLACLIIRMALAETFSNRFGILALDEPTTNLDKENIGSLCSALGDIVLSRMNQSNFMFIIITHDAEFLKALGGIDKLTHYYQLTRNREGRSRIAKMSMT